MENGIQPYSFGIIRILDCGFSIQELIPPDPDKILIGYGMNFLFDVQEGWIEFVLKAEFKHSDHNQTFLTGNVLTRFAIIDFASFLGEDGKVFFPPGCLETLFGIAFGHLRAIMAKNVSGSRFAGVIVPVINPHPIFHELLKNNLEAEKKFKEPGGIKKEEKITAKNNIDLAPTVNTVEDQTISEQLEEARKRIKRLKTMSNELREGGSKKVSRKN